MYAINKLQSNRSIYQVDVLSVNFRLESVIGGNPEFVAKLSEWWPEIFFYPDAEIYSLKFCE